MTCSRSKIIFPLLSVLFVFLLCSCGGNGVTATLPNAELSEGQSFVFNPFSCHMGVYDINTFTWKAVDGLFANAFDMGNNNDCFTFYNESDGKSHVFETGDKTLEYFYSTKEDGVLLYPFCGNERYTLYIFESDDSDPSYRRVVTLDRGGNVEEILDLDGMHISDGVLIGEKLYVSDYGFGNDAHTVYSYDLSADDPVSTQTVEKENYYSGLLFSYRGKAVYMDDSEKFLYSDEVKIPVHGADGEIYLDPQAELLFELYPDDNDTLQLVVTDVDAGEVKGRYENAVNFVREGDKITVYCKGSVQTLELTD